jgi:hypothetical protein
MNEKLLSRLDALAEVAADIRDKIQGRDAGQLDGLALARLLVAVDAAAKRLGQLADELQPALFPSAAGNDQDDAAPASPKQAMLGSMAPLTDPVPVEVEVKISPNWAGD